MGPRDNISRQPGAWYVIVTRRGMPYTRYFSDAVWGGKRLALVAAQRYRDRLLRRIEPDTRVRRKHPRGSRNETRHVGVSFEEYEVEGRWYERFIADWKDADGRQMRRRFSVNKYGLAEAEALAVEARNEGVAESRAVRRARQREEALARLKAAPPMPRKVKDPKSRKGMRMPPRNHAR